MATPDLVTSAELLAFWPVAAKLPGPEQSALITAASRTFEVAADYIFGSTTYTEIKRPGRVRKIYTRQRPITAIARVATDFGTVLTIQNTDATIQRASAGFTSTGIPEEYPTFTGLTLTGVASGVPIAPISLPFATYPTIGSLSTAINTLPGWASTVAQGEANVTGGSFENWASTDLAPDLGQQGVTVLANELKAYTRDLDFGCDTQMSRRGIIDIYEGRPDGYRYPDRRFGPLSSGYSGISGISGGLDARVGDVLVVYTAGYQTANVPEDIKRAVLGLAKWLYDTGRFSGFKSETLNNAAASYRYEIMQWKHALPDWIMGIAYNRSRKEIP